jgi:hypothetical protein
VHGVSEYGVGKWKLASEEKNMSWHQFEHQFTWRYVYQCYITASVSVKLHYVANTSYINTSCKLFVAIEAKLLILCSG